MSYPIAAHPLWAPDAARIADANITDFARKAEARWGRRFADYAALHAWSVDRPEEFWASIWAYGEVKGSMGETVLEHGDRMPGARWFPEARLNFAENLLRQRDDSDALVFWGEDRVHNRLAHSDLYRQVAHLAAALKELGVE
uniref:acetyl-coenzyme A synthetase N-terminal domain-containing protein n=1 Tax=Zoogloea sp. TaxID=49181 RepID=UPI0035B1C70A